MSSETSLNQIVKGAPPPGTRVSKPAPLPPLAKASSETIEQIVHQKPQPASFAGTAQLPRLHHEPPSATTEFLPSSPPQIYLNLLILESSLRQQYLSLVSRRRLNTFFLTLLAVWNITFTYALFFRPREDGGGFGGSPYWVVEACIRLSFIAGILTAFLIWATGQYETGIKWPRKWLSTTNRGLRGFNLRLVVVKRGFWSELMSYARALAPVSGIADGSGDWHLVESPASQADVEHGRGGSIVEEDLSASGDHLLLFLLPKNFSSEFRDNWETYRSEYWDSENKRREKLRAKVLEHKRSKAREFGGWKWWTGAWRLIPRKNRPKTGKGDLEKHAHGQSEHGRPQSRRNSTLIKDGLDKAARRRSLLRESSAGGHSRGSSRSSTPHYMLDGTLEIMPGDSKRERVRRGSSVSSTASVRRSLRSGTGSIKRESMLSPLTMTDEPEEMQIGRKRRSRPNTPTVSSSESVSGEVKKEVSD